MSYPSFSFPWTLLESLSQELGLSPGLQLELFRPSNSQETSTWHIHLPHFLNRYFSRTFPDLTIPHISQHSHSQTLTKFLFNLQQALSFFPSSVHRLIITLGHGHTLLTIETSEGFQVLECKPRPGKIRLTQRHSILSLRPHLSRSFALWAKTSPDHLDIETETGSAHARLTAEAALPPCLRALGDLWPPETRPRLRVRTWPGIAAAILVHTYSDHRRYEFPFLLARRGISS